MQRLKKCSRCGKVLPIDLFAPHTSHCRICRRDYDWQYRYGLSPEQYLELYEKQKGRCAICHREPKAGEYLCVDHDHFTGKIRGLLCKSCNFGMANFEDNMCYVQSAFNYLAKFNSEHPVLDCSEWEENADSNN